MHIWETENLIKELSNGSMTQWDMTQYLIATTVLWYLTGTVYYDPTSVEISEWITRFVIAAVAGFGIYYCFTINRKYGDKEFIVRFTVLSWPVSLRWLLIAVMLYLITATILNRYSKSLTDNYLFDSLFQVALEIIYFWMLSNYIRATGNNEKKI